MKYNFFHIVSLCVIACYADTHHFTGNPYVSRSDITSNVETYRSLRHREDGTPPMKTEISWPDVPGTYPFLFFSGGLGGEIPELVYTDLINDIVRKGFVVVYPFSGIHFINVTDWTSELNYMIENINPILTTETNGVVAADTESLLLFCHSAGCGPSKYFAIENDIFSAYFFLDPTLNAKQTDLYSAVPVDTDALVIVQKTEWCGMCCLNNKNQLEIYNSFTSTRGKMFNLIANAGHCSALNYLAAKGCAVTHMCNMGEISALSMRRYHSCNAAQAVALFTDGLFPDDKSMYTYWQQPNNYCDGYQIESDALCNGPEIMPAAECQDLEDREF